MSSSSEYTIRECFERYIGGLVIHNLLDETTLLRMSVDRARDPLSGEAASLLKMVAMSSRSFVNQSDDSAAELVAKGLAIWFSSPSLAITWYGLAYLASSEGIV